MSKPTVEVVSHCYAMNLDHYAAHLCYQWSSFLLNKPEKCDVIATVCTCKDDEITDRVVAWFLRNTPLNIRQIILDRRSIGRRAIGRNIAALGSKADYVWFADVDQFYGPGCLDQLVSLEWPETVVMVFPRMVKINNDWVTGDGYVGSLARDPHIVNINDEDFKQWHYNRAVGGVQIVKGDFARQYGYLNNNKRWQAQVEPFQSCREDPHYRRYCSKFGKIIRVDLHWMYRLRHTIAGRDLRPGVARAELDQKETTQVVGG